VGWSLNKYQIGVREIELKIKLIINVFGGIITSCDEYIVIKTWSFGTVGVMLVNLNHPILLARFLKM
jgi:hypothetical protein